MPVWTSFAQFSTRCILLTRTAPGHDGITAFFVDLDTPGITIRPLRTMHGVDEFCEVYFDDVVIPKDRIIGAVNAGWGIAMHTLSHERGPAVAARAVKLRVLLDRLIADARRLECDGRPVVEDDAVRSALVRTHIQLEVLRCQSARTVGRMIATGKPGLETSLDKLQLTRAEQLLGDAALVTCYEGSNDDPAHLAATNVFVLEGERWRMVHHHAGPIASPVRRRQAPSTLN